MALEGTKLEVFFLFLILVSESSTSRISSCSDGLEDGFPICSTGGHRYHPKVPPRPESGGPLNIDTYIEIVDIRSVNENDYFFTIALALTTNWTDPRLDLRPGSEDVDDGSFEIPTDGHELVWGPKLYIYDLRTFRKVSSVHQDQISLLRIGSGGQMKSTDRFEVDITCGYNHTLFPFDTQTCYFRYGVLGDDDESQIVFNAATFKDWTKESDPRYMAQATKLSFDKQIESLGRQSFKFDKTYSYTGLKMVLFRKSHKFVGNFFLPTMLFVVFSWLSFVINIEQVPGRMGLLVTLYLILTNTFSTTLTISPPVQGMGVVSWWMIGCQSNIFLALAEYGFVLYCYKYANHKSRGKSDRRRVVPIMKVVDKTTIRVGKITMDLVKLDWYCIFVVPGFYLAFNLVFWIRLFAFRE